MFDKHDTVITEDNIEASKARWDAIKAVQANRATPEQVALVRDADRVMKEAMENRRK